MKITIIGGGNAGCWTALHFAYYAPKTVEIELIYDKNIPAEPVGQGTTPAAATMLWNVLGIDWHSNSIKATPKSGVLYKGWGKRNKEYYHAFPMDTMALHYEPRELHRCVLESKLFKVKEGNIRPEEIDSDYVIDASGKPNSFETYEMLDNPLNAALISRKNRCNANVDMWTRCSTTPDGWCFEIDNLDGTTSYGYLYNEHWSKEEDCRKNLESQFGITEARRLKFNNYVSKAPIINERIIQTGNKLFFLEPLEATALKTYSHWARMIFDFTITKRKSSEECQREIHNYIRETEAFINLHYAFGSSYNTRFWRKCEQLYRPDRPGYERIKSHIREDWRERNERKIAQQQSWGQWGAYSLGGWYEAMGVEIAERQLDLAN